MQCEAPLVVYRLRYGGGGCSCAGCGVLLAIVGVPGGCGVGGGDSRGGGSGMRWGADELGWWRLFLPEVMAVLGRLAAFVACCALGCHLLCELLSPGCAAMSMWRRCDVAAVAMWRQWRCGGNGDVRFCSCLQCGLHLRCAGCGAAVAMVSLMAMAGVLASRKGTAAVVP